jgi:uncharacterized protein DUF3592
MCQTGRIMLIEIWERLRGYDKWIQTEAKIVTSEEIRSKLGEKYRRRDGSNLLFWQDQQGEPQYGAFVTFDTSPLYQTLEGEGVSIRYNPARPSRYYCRPLFLSWAAQIAKAVLGVAIFGGFLVWRIWSIIERRGL